MTFDLYDNSNAQTINFTTSCTGAVTVSQNDYITTSVSGNTITVTPVKVTPETQTITVSQAADETYADGTATFTVTITDSTPIVATNWQKTSLADLSANDIFVIVGNNGSNYALTNDNGTGSAPSAVEVTVRGDYLTGEIADNIKWNVAGNANDGYTFYPNGSTTTWLYCTATNNGVRVGDNSNKTFKISDEGYLLHIGTSRYVGIYSSQDWRCYTSINANIENQTFAFYKYVGAPEPTISANNVEIANDATLGSISYTIGNAVEGGTLTASSNAEWLTIGTITSEAVPFTTSVNTANTERSATVTLTYAYESKTVTKDVTVTQAAAPAALMTIAEVREQGTGNVSTKGVVTSCTGITAYIQDDNSAICVYGKELIVGDEIKVSGTLSTYKGLLEITNPEYTVLSSENTVDPEVMTIAQINESTKQGWLVKIENAMVTAISGQNTTIAQGDETITVHGITGVEYNVGDLLTLTGNIGCFENVQIANPQNITVQQNTTPLIIAVENVNLAADATSGEITYTIENPVDEKALTAETSADWISNINVDAEKVTFTTTANTGAARTATITLSYDGAESKDVTVNQAAYIAPITGGKFVKVTSTADLTDGEYLIVYEEGSVAFNGALETLDAASNTIDVTINNNEIAATQATNAAVFTIDVTAGTLKSASGKYIGQNSDANGLASSTTGAYTNTLSINTEGNADIVSSGGAYLRYNAASNQARFRYFKSSSYTGQKAIQLYKKVSATPEPEFVAATISAKATDGTLCYGTLYYSDKALVVPEGVEACTYAVIDGKLIDSKTYQEGSVIPADEAVVIYSLEAGTYNFAVTTETADKDEDNMLLGTDGSTTTTAPEGSTVEYKFYALSLNSSNADNSVGFYYRKGCPNGEAFTNGEHKAYLAVPANQAPAKGFVLGDETDGIEQIEKLAIDNTVIYDLSGRKINEVSGRHGSLPLPKGIYIVNGKKVVIK